MNNANVEFICEYTNVAALARSSLHNENGIVASSVQLIRALSFFFDCLK